MNRPILITLSLLLIATLREGAFAVSEVETAIVTRFGRPVRETISDAGLHFKLPFVEKVNLLDKRWLEWDGDAREMNTKEKTPIWVDAYARWRIKDPLQFFLKNSKRGISARAIEAEAQSKLDGIINGATRNVIAAYPLIEVVRSSNRKFAAVSEDADGDTASPDHNRNSNAEQDKRLLVKEGREKISQEILIQAQKDIKDIGIELVDVQFQRVNYTPTIEQKVFERMISERQRITARYRSEGEGESARIRGEMERELQTIESMAYKTVEEVKGNADAVATAIYAAAHGEDPEFYRFLRSLESYEKSIDKNTTLLLSDQGDYFKSLTTVK